MNLYDLVVQLQKNEFILFLLILIICIVTLITVRYLLKISAPYFFLGLLGIILGLIIGSIISSPFTKLPGSIGIWFPPILNIFISVAILDLFLAQGKALSRYVFPLVQNQKFSIHKSQNNCYVVDSSVLIDGRINEIVKAHFLHGKYLISNLVIKELQRLSNEDDLLKKLKGQRGLDMLSALQNNPNIDLENVNQGYLKNVDDSLVSLAKEKQAYLLTTDVALAKISRISGGVIALNINELASALKPLILPGEDIDIHLVEQGKSRSQAIGYLSDGTMVVVNNAEKFIGQNVKTRVDKIHQTTTGNIIFSKLLD